MCSEPFTDHDARRRWRANAEANSVPGVGLDGNPEAAVATDPPKRIDDMRFADYQRAFDAPDAGRRLLGW